MCAALLELFCLQLCGGGAYMCPPDLLRVLAAAAVECVNALEIKHVGLHLRA